MPKFQYRWVQYGVDFSPTMELRDSVDGAEHQLHANELAVDVGGVCWGHNGEERAVLDHHFFRPEGQFPSSAAAVLHNAKRIRDRFAGQAGPIWLVTHRQPDFDAFCAVYLARGILQGDIPHDGWTDFGLHAGGWLDVAEACPRIDWFQPQVAQLEANRRWPILLAAYAACVDNCRRIRCPKARTLHSVLYAALCRGRNYIAQSHAAEEFFDEAKERIGDDRNGLNPLFDSVLQDSNLFAPELELLDRESQAYDRDIGRARRAIVYVQGANHEFQTWFAEVQSTPLVGNTGRVQEIHLRPSTGHDEELSHRALDGIYLRDPECLLFKEWARFDTEHSSMGMGFPFTAVAYSRGRPGAVRNETDYYFALDPERADNLHLYNVWARLQEQELGMLRGPEGAVLRERLEALRRAETKPGEHNACRSGFEERAGEQHRDVFDDPWFDGHNYGCTIVATPNRGTLMPAGTAPDLSDDPVAAVVQRELEHAVFASDIVIEDLSASSDVQGASHPHLSPHDPDVPATRAGCYRFCSVELKQDVDLLEGNIPEQVGRVLWRLLDTQSGPSVPADFQERYLVQTTNWIAVWNRRGIAVAYKPKQAARERIDEWKSLLMDLAGLSRDIQTYNNRPDLVGTQHAGHASSKGELVTAEGARLTHRVAEVNHALTLPDNGLLQKFFSETRLADVLASVHSTQLEVQQSNNLSLLASLQNKIEWVEVAIVAVYMIEIMHILHGVFEHGEAGGAHHGIPWVSVIQGLVILVLALGAGVATFVFLQPFRHEVDLDATRRRARWFFPIVIALPVVYFIFQTAWFVYAPSHLPPPAQIDSNSTTGSEDNVKNTPPEDGHEHPSNEQ